MNLSYTCLDKCLTKEAVLANAQPFPFSFYDIVCVYVFYDLSAPVLSFV